MRDWLSHRVVAAPNATALVRAADGEAWTYADLDRLVEATAGRLAAHGVTPETHLGVHLSPRVGYVGLIHAAMRLGATLVPIGHQLTPREIGVRLDRADVDVLVCGAETERTALDGTAAAEVPILSVDAPAESATSDESIDAETAVTALHDSEPTSVPTPSWETDDRLCVLFTSGTSGQPKAVEITAGNVLCSAIASGFRLGVHPDDRWLVTLPLHHAGGLSPIYRSVLAGTTVVLREEFDPGDAADDIDRYDVTGVSLVPTMLTRMLDRRGTLSDSLETVLLGGAPASEGLIERCENYSIPVYPTYGMTETASQIATATPAEAFDDPGTVGRPVFWTDRTIIGDDGEPVDRGETGEIVVSGPTVSPGYYNDPDATAEAFSDYGLHTGDIGRIDEDGNLHVINRVDDRIVTGGENVDPGEVAAVLADHDAVSDAAVLGIPDETWGERVGALLVPAAQSDSATDSSGTAGGQNGTTEDADRDTGDDETDADGDRASENVDQGADTAGIEDAADAAGTADTADTATEATNEAHETDTTPESIVAAESADTAPEVADRDTPAPDPSTEADAPPHSAATDGTQPTPGADRDPPIDEREFFAYARQRLAGFKMPRTVAYVESLPRTVSGTIDRDAARDQLIEEGVDPSIPSVEFDRAGFEPADPEPVNETDETSATDETPATDTDVDRSDSDREST